MTCKTCHKKIFGKEKEVMVNYGFVDCFNCRSKKPPKIATPYGIKTN
jgi:hypothetical protein